jgi:molybdopterin/thiamine biosynthesis adenylyltransferase
MSDKEFWDLTVDNFKCLIDGDPRAACKQAREAFHEIARCGDIEHSQAVAEAWMRILEPFMQEESDDGE